LAVERPVYDFATHTRKPQPERFSAREFLIVEGLFALYWPELRQLAGTKVFVEAPNRVCLRRRTIRDVAERGRSEASVITQFEQTVQPMAELYIRPTSKYADLVLSGEQSLSRSIEAALNHVRNNWLQAAGGRTVGTQLLAAQKDASSAFLR
jgi:uridine kinase